MVFSAEKVAIRVIHPDHARKHGFRHPSGDIAIGQFPGRSIARKYFCIYAPFNYFTNFHWSVDGHDLRSVREAVKFIYDHAVKAHVLEERQLLLLLRAVVRKVAFGLQLALRLLVALADLIGIGPAHHGLFCPLLRVLEAALLPHRDRGVLLVGHDDQPDGALRDLVHLLEDLGRGVLCQQILHFDLAGELVRLRFAVLVQHRFRQDHTVFAALGLEADEHHVLMVADELLRLHVPVGQHSLRHYDAMLLAPPHLAVV